VRVIATHRFFGPVCERDALPTELRPHIRKLHIILYRLKSMPLWRSRNPRAHAATEDHGVNACWS
jgi:hypothetical protein